MTDADASKTARDSAAEIETQVLVIGAGIAGVSAALRAARESFENFAKV